MQTKPASRVSINNLQGRRKGWQPLRLALGRITLALLAASVLTVAGLAQGSNADNNGANERWVGTWGNALHEPDLGVPGLANPGFNNQTLRQIVHNSVGGAQVRVRLSTFGAGALVVGAAHIALRGAAPASIAPGSDRRLTFGGAPSITIPPGALVVSDPVELNVPELSEMAVSIFVPGGTGPASLAFRGTADLVYLSAGRFYSQRSDAVYHDDTGTVLAGGSGRSGVPANGCDRCSGRLDHGWFAVDCGRQHSMARPIRPAAAGSTR